MLHLLGFTFDTQFSSSCLITHYAVLSVGYGARSATTFWLKERITGIKAVRLVGERESSVGQSPRGASVSLRGHKNFRLDTRTCRLLHRVPVSLLS